MVKFSVYLNRHVFVMRLNNFSSCGQRRIGSDCADEEAYLSLRWVQISKGTFLHIAAHMFFTFNLIIKKGVYTFAGEKILSFFLLSERWSALHFPELTNLLSSGGK